MQSFGGRPLGLLIRPSMDDEYMKARAADVRDISERLVSILKGSGSGELNTDEPVVVIAEDLAPSETVQLDKDKILSFVTVHGRIYSAAAVFWA